MNIKKYLSIGMALIFTSVAMEISLFAPKKVYASVQGPYTVTTIAGTGTRGFSGDGGDATSATLNNPRGIALDSSGNVYIDDSQNGRIRKVDTKGKISTVAGSSNWTLGDGGPATSAYLSNPNGLDVDSYGNIYIADLGNARVRKVDTTGNISTVAGSAQRGQCSGDGGDATSATFVSVSDVAIDSIGDLYICDLFDNRIRKVDTTGKISTIAGTGEKGYSGDGGAATSAKLNYPVGVAVDKSGNVYIADTGNNKLRKVDTAGKISTIAGTGVGEDSLSYPNGVAVDGSGNVYVTDLGHGIRKVDTTGKISTIQTDKWLSSPYGITVDKSGNIYVCDCATNLVEKLTPGPSLYTVTYDGNGNTAGTLPTDSTNYNSGDTATAKTAWTFTRDGYKFTGWNTSSDGKGTAIAEGQNFNITGDTTLYAQWAPIASSSLDKTTADFDKNIQNAKDISINMTLNGNTLKEIRDAEASLGSGLIKDKDYTVDGNVVTIKKSYLEQLSTGTTTLAFNFSAGEPQYLKVTITDTTSKDVSINPTTANFDKETENQADVNVSMGIWKYELNSISGLGGYLPDNVINGNTLTVKKSDLLKITSSAELTFCDDKGNTKELNVSKQVTDAGLILNLGLTTNGSFGQTMLTGITNEGNTLVNGTDYIVNGNQVTIKKGLLTKLGTGTINLMLNFGKENLAVTMSTTATDIKATMTLYENTLTGITNGTYNLINGKDYTVNGNIATIKKSYLATLGVGTATLALNFSEGNPQNLNVTVKDTTPIIYTVTFNNYDGTTIGTQTAVSGSKITEPAVPVRTGYTFGGWYTDAACQNKYDFANDTVTSNVTLYQKWTINSYKVTFKNDDGTVIGNVQTVEYGESAKAPANPEKTGYVFAGWSKNFDKVTGDLVVIAEYTSGSTYNFDSKPTDKPGETKISTDYLKSRDNTLVITNPAADLAIPANAIDLVDGADHIKVTEKVVTPETNALPGLFSNLPNSTRMVGNPINLNVQLLKADDTTVVEDVHQFANNQTVKVTIKLTLAQISGLDTSKLSMYYYDETSKTWVELGGSFDLSKMEFTFNTPHFTNFAIMDKVSTPAPTVTSYTVTFKDYDGSTIGTPQTVNNGGNAVAPTNMTREGYTFTGWDKTFNNVTGDLVVTAQYSINNYAVTFKDYDGKTLGDVQSVKYGESAVAPAAPTRAGYVFAGWDKAFDKVTGDLVVTATYKSGNTYNFKPTTTNNGDETKISADYLTSGDNTLVITKDNAEISIPAGAIDLANGTSYVKVTEQSEAASEVSKQFGSLPKDLNQVGNPLLLSIQLFDANNNYIKDVNKLSNNEKIKVTMKFTPDELKGVISSGLTMYYYNETTKAWTKLDGSFNPNTMEMTFYMTTL